MGLCITIDWISFPRECVYRALFRNGCLFIRLLHSNGTTRYNTLLSHIRLCLPRAKTLYALLSKVYCVYLMLVYLAILIMSCLHAFPLALQPSSGLGRLHETFRFTSVTSSRTVGRTPLTGDQLYTDTEKRTHNTNTRQSCPEWDSNPRSRPPRERRQIMLGHRDRSLSSLLLRIKYYEILYKSNLGAITFERLSMLYALISCVRLFSFPIRKSEFIRVLNYLPRHDLLLRS
jgi:hypothetical protein